MTDVTSITCRRCGRRVTSEAPRCPECGADPRSGESTYLSRGSDRVRVCQGVGIRFLAQAIDAVCLFLVFILVALGIFLFLAGSGDFAEVGEEPKSWPLWIGFMLASFVYYWLCEGLWGRTLGKRFCDLRVLRTDGAPLGLGRAFVRTLLRAVDVLPAFYLVGAVLVWVTPRDQRLGDLAAGTVVVRPRMVELELLDDLGRRAIPWRDDPGSSAA